MLCESCRAKLLCNLLDVRSYTASELALASDLSPSATSNHLSKLLNGDIVKVDAQGRHRYYSFANAHVAYVIESLANLVSEEPVEKYDKQIVRSGIKYCRTCYDHLAGYVGVTITDALVEQGYLKEYDSNYHVTEKGWDWFSQFEILENDFTKDRRPLTRQCLDWSERRPHLAGRLGAIFLEKMLQDRWFKRVEFSRELIITARGSKLLDDCLNIVFV